LAAGTISRSDGCRVASTVFQIGFAVLFLAGALDVINTHRGGVVTMVLDPAAHLAAPFAVLMPLSCLVVACLLLAARTRATAATNRLTSANLPRSGNTNGNAAIEPAMHSPS
jgi:H+/Cl- antiporter ClcA